MNHSKIVVVARSAAIVTLAAIVVACSGGKDIKGEAGSGAIPEPLAATPAGITLVDVVREMNASQPEYLWTRLGDATGRTLFISDSDTQSGVSNCNDECAREFVPLEALAGSKAYGEWTLVSRVDGKTQWAFQGKPLYTFAKETKLNEVVDNIVFEESKKNKLAQRFDADAAPRLMPPKGWNVARFDPGGALTKPTDLSVRMLITQIGVGPGLVDARGMTLYGFDGGVTDEKQQCVGPRKGGGCDSEFKPALAPISAVTEIGDFGIVTRKEDQSKQWSFRGVPLYTYSGDFKPGDTFGVYHDNGRWRVMLLAEDRFPTNVQYVEARVRGQILATSAGMPLYARARFEDRWGGFTVYQGYSAPYRMGKYVGAGGCNEECLKTRIPLAAPADAKSSGYWEVYDRKDGTKQWAYKGFAVYTYTKDPEPGVVSGHNVTDYVIGNDPSYTIADAKEGEPPNSQNKVAGLFWYVARP